MGLESPVGGGIKTCGCKGTFYAEILLMCLNAVRNLFQRFKIIQLVDGGDFRIGQCKIIIQQRFVIDDTVGFDNICHTENGVAFLQYIVITFDILINFTILQVIAVILPGCQAYRSVYLEQGRRF